MSTAWNATPRKVAVIGAGMGGLSVAIALRKIGIAVTVFERAASFAPIGICLSIFPNGQRALAAIAPELPTRIRERGYALRTMCIRKPNAELVAQKPHDFEARFGLPLIAIRWSSLQQLLLAELPNDVIQMGRHVLDAREDAEGILLRFETGESEPFDLAVATDGVHSILRSHLTDDAAVYAGRVSCRAVIPMPQTLDVPEGVMIDQATGQTFASGPVGEGHVFWNAMVQGPREQAELTGGAARAFVLDRYQGFDAIVRKLVEATPESEILVRPILTREPLSCMHRGRLVVMGDAAHAMQLSTGQGANLSFEDSLELAQCLATFPTLSDGLGAFDARRVPRAQTVHARNALISNKAHSADAHQFMKGVVERAQLGEADFQEYLHRYTPEGGLALA